MIDPVCGMEVEAETAAAAWEHRRRTYFFCSLGCFERFRADPQAVLDAGPSGNGM
jgi:Cu+-exporting ATPase